MATKCFKEGCEEKARTDNQGQTPLILTKDVFSYSPPALKGGERKSFRDRLYFCSPACLFDYLLDAGVVSREERNNKASVARDDSFSTRRELDRIRRTKPKREEREKKEARGPEPLSGFKFNLGLESLERFIDIDNAKD